MHRQQTLLSLHPPHELRVREWGRPAENTDLAERRAASNKQQSQQEIGKNSDGSEKT